MMKKKYEVPGMMEWHPEFRIGRTKVQIPFTGGHTCGGASTSACYETSDPVVQAIIEGSAPYRGGRIRLKGQSKEKEHNSSCKKGAGNACVFEYTDIEDVYDFLQREKGIPLDLLCSSDSCFKEAKKLGITLKKKN